MANLMPGEWDIMTQEAARKRKFADMLRQQQEPQGQMVSGYYVAPSWTQRLASVLNQYQAGKLNRQAEEQERGAIQKQRETYQNAGQRLAEALRGKQADPNDATMPGATGYQPASMDDIQNAQVQYAQDIGEPQAMQQAVQGIIAQRNQAQLRNDDREFRTQSREDEQAFRAEQSQLQREAQAQSLAQQIAAREQAGRDSADLRRELAQMQMQNSRDLARFSAANRQPAAPVVTEVIRDGKNVKIDARTGAVIGESPKPGTTRPMSATAQKELIETDEALQGANAALSLLKQAGKLNDSALGFTGAGALSSMGTLLPEAIRPNAIDATQNLDNILQSQALPQLKLIFGGMPTEGERKILLDVQGSSSKPAKVRKEIFKRAEAAIMNRAKFAEDKAKKLRSGTYFSDSGAPDTSYQEQPSGGFQYLGKE